MFSHPSRIAAIAASAIAIGACGGKADYPASSERSFLDNCEQTGGDTKSCDCALDKIQGEFSYDEFKKEEAAIQAGSTPSRKLTDAAAECSD